MADPTDQQMLSAYKAAELAIVQGGAAETQVNGRTFKAQDLDKIRSGIAIYQRKVNRAAGQPGFAVADFGY